MNRFRGLKPDFGRQRFQTAASPYAETPEQVNVVFVYGAGNDNKYGGGVRYLQEQCVGRYGNRIYSPRIIDWREENTLEEMLLAWADPSILVGHSCAGQTVTRVAVTLSGETLPFIMCIAPSIWCEPNPVNGNVARLNQATSNYRDFYNPGGRTLISKTESNDVTVLDTIYTGASHLDAPYSDLVRDRLFSEIDIVLDGAEPIPPEPEPRPLVTVTIAKQGEVDVVVNQ